MRKFLSKLKETFSGPDYEGEQEQRQDYVELEKVEEGEKQKLLVKPYQLEDFEGIKGILDDLRVGNTIALINIGPLKEKDIVELKRAISKLKKTIDAIDGHLAGFGEEYLVASPSNVKIERPSTREHENSQEGNMEEY
ncbi:cell division protein SepF [Candidatus Woesearchaeota archaeon]|nr:cell division protein SepF [Candidatus Woesearchaeota archaeon]